MKNTYTVTAKSCENPNITVEFKGLCSTCSIEVVSILECAFRSVEIICEETGEVVYTLYVGSEWFIPNAEYGKAIDEAGEIIRSYIALGDD